MKTWKIGMLLLLFACILGACDDDENNSPLEEGANPPGTSALAGTGFGYEAKAVLKNSGRLEIPVALDKTAAVPVKLTVGVSFPEGEKAAREGIDFAIGEKVVTIPVGDTLGYVGVDILDRQQVDKDREFTVNITGVYGGGRITEARSSCRISIMSNSFVEFEKAEWSMYESSAMETAPEDRRNLRFVPMLVTGEVTEASTVVLGVRDSSASEYIHFTLKEHEVQVNPGDSRILVEVLPVDDDEANDDRKFELYIKDIRGGNLTAGPDVPVSVVTLVSEEVRKTVGFQQTGILKAEEGGADLLVPVIIDKMPQVPVKVRVGVDKKSTAVSGVDFEIEDTEIVFSNAFEANIRIKMLDNAEINNDKKLILNLVSAEGDNAFLAEDAKTVEIRIENDDFPSFGAESFQLEEDLVHKIKVSLPAVDRERTVRLEVSGHYLFTLPSASATLAAGETDLEVAVKAGYTDPYPETPVSTTLKVVEVDGVVLEDPAEVRIDMVECRYRKLLGAWDFVIGSYDANGAQEENLAREMMLEQKEWNKSFTFRFELIMGWPADFEIEYNKETGAMKMVKEGPIYKNVSFGDLRCDFYWKTAVDNDKFWSVPNMPLPLVWDATAQVYRLEISKKFGLCADSRKAGTMEAVNVAWFKFNDIYMKKK